MLHYATVLVAASFVLGQTDGPSRSGDFNKLRGFLGTWEAKDVQTAGGVGDVLVSWKPILEGKFIEQRYVLKGEGNDPLEQGLIMIGRDPADNKVRGWWFDDKGGIAVTQLTDWDGSKSNWSTTFHNADGTTEKTEANHLSIQDKDRYELLLAIAGGEKSEAVFRRVRPKKMQLPERQYDAPAGLAPQLRDISWWAGKYAADGVNAFTQKALTGYTRCGWVLNGRFLLFDSASLDTDLELARYRAVIGIDPQTGQATGWEFSSAGNVGRYTLSNQGQDIKGEVRSPDSGLLKFQGKMTNTGDGLKYEASGDLNGKQTTIYGGTWKRLK